MKLNSDFKHYFEDSMDFKETLVSGSKHVNAMHFS